MTKDEETELLAAVERGELESVAIPVELERYRAIARNTLAAMREAKGSE